MDVLVVGSGAREHALYRALEDDPDVAEVGGEPLAVDERSVGHSQDPKRRCRVP